MRPDPSMEDILASIKRIIADGDRKPNGRSLSPETDHSDDLRKHDSDSSVLELTDPVTSSLSKDQPMNNEHRDYTENNTPLNGHSSKSQDSLMSEKAEQASRQALKNLSAMMVSQTSHQDLTLEDLVKEMLRPMLKDWLDSNLPAIVEAMVSREISRITGQHL
ncbi:hypothetical protein FBY58_0020 [Zymomonas mobilis]|uniref:DUF2497 domain-containing protein n=2 Tax=Zymomonas mobilis TaxID=542 RepID=A0A542VYU4_ZYMMB|nr:hypothetical protein FBY58_0020 [Zymomonas mobilis]